VSESPLLDETRGATVTGRLARLGFSDPRGAEQALDELGLLAGNDSSMRYETVPACGRVCSVCSAPVRH
jgi:hypothetical protein